MRLLKNLSFRVLVAIAMNLIGNGVATLVVSRMEGAYDNSQREIAGAQQPSVQAA